MTLLRSYVRCKDKRNLGNLGLGDQLDIWILQYQKSQPEKNTKEGLRLPFAISV